MRRGLIRFPPSFLRCRVLICFAQNHDFSLCCLLYSRTPLAMQNETSNAKDSPFVRNLHGTETITPRIIHAIILHASNVESHAHNPFSSSPALSPLSLSQSSISRSHQLYHTIRHANVIAERMATTLARATEAGPRASAPQQGRL